MHTMRNSLFGARIKIVVAVGVAARSQNATERVICSGVNFISCQKNSNLV